MHRLPLEQATSGAETGAPLPWPVDQAGRIGLERPAALLAGVDFVACAAAVWILTLHGDLPQAAHPLLAASALAAAACLLWGGLASAGRLYAHARLSSGRGLAGRALLAACTLYGPVLATALPLGRAPGLPLAILGTAAGVTVLARIAWRRSLAAALRQGRCLERAVVIAQTPSAARILAASIERLSGNHLRVVACITATTARTAAFDAWIAELLRTRAAGRFVVSASAGTVAEVRTLAWGLAGAGADVSIAEQQDGGRWHLARWPATGPHAGPAPYWGPGRAAAKRAFDILVSALALILCLPLLLVVALAIKLDSRGPVLFRQLREGAGQSTFRIWKFRTMADHAPDDANSLQTSRNDRRVTRVGRLLRKTSLDEVPQLFNVLRGDMSIVGPRPHAIGMLIAGRSPAALLADYDHRYVVKPGITGWAQVNGSRGELDSARALRRRFALDRHYIENGSLLFDMAIMMRTVLLPLRDVHAY